MAHARQELPGIEVLGKPTLTTRGVNCRLTTLLVASFSPRGRQEAQDLKENGEGPDGGQNVPPELQEIRLSGSLSTRQLRGTRDCGRRGGSGCRCGNISGVLGVDARFCGNLSRLSSPAPRNRRQRLHGSDCRYRGGSCRLSRWLRSCLRRIRRSCGIRRSLGQQRGIGLQTSKIAIDRAEEPSHPATVAAGRLACGGSEQDPRQLSSTIEDRAARVPVAGPHGDLDHFRRIVPPGRNVLDATPGRHAVVSRAISGNGQRVARIGSLGGDGNGLNRWTPDRQGCQVPVPIGSQHRGAGSKPVGKGHNDLTARVPNHVPVGHNEPVILFDGHQRARPEGVGAVPVIDDDPRDRRMNTVGGSHSPLRSLGRRGGEWMGESGRRRIGGGRCGKPRHGVSREEDDHQTE